MTSSGLVDRSQQPLIIICTCLILTMLAGIALSRLLYPYDLGHYEACIWTPAHLIATGHNPYHFATRPPFVMAPYGPLYYLLIGIGLRVFGDQLWFGRVLSLAAMCVILICIARISFTLTRNRAATWLALLAALSLFTLQVWIALQRPDLPALAFAFVGLALVFQPDPMPDKITARLLIIITMFAAAFLCKQTIILPAGIAAARCLQLGKARQALFIPLGTIILCVLVMWFLNETSDGGYLWQHWEMARQAPRSIPHALRTLPGLVSAPSTWIILLLIGASIFKLLVFSSHNFTDEYKADGRHEPRARRLLKLLRSPVLLIWAYLIAASMVAFMTASAAGANVNYWLEASLAAAIAMAPAFTLLSPTSLTGGKGKLVIILLTVSAAFTIARMSRGEYYRWKSLPYYREVVTTLARTAPPGAVCVSIFPELATYAGCEYHFGDPVQYNDGRSAELQRIFDEAITSKYYKAIIWSDPNTSFSGYRLVPMRNNPPERFRPVYLYVREQ